MTKSHTKRAGAQLAFLDALRVPLMIGVSVVALSVSANADTANVPGIGDVNVPGWQSADTSVWVMKDQSGNTIAGNYNSSLAPTVAYGSEAGHVGAYNYTLGADTYYLVDANGKFIASGSLSTAPTATDPGTGNRWVLGTATDPLVTWQKPTYADLVAGGVAAVANYIPVADPALAHATNSWSAHSVYVGADGKPVNVADPLNANVVGTWVPAGNIATAPSLDNTGHLLAADGSAAAYSAHQNSGANTVSSLGSGGAPANQTTTFAGGAVYSNSNGQYYAIGPDGTYAVGAGAVYCNPGLTSCTAINNGQVQSTVVGGPNAGQTTINGGRISTSGNVTVTNAFGDTASLTSNAKGAFAGLKVTSGTDPNNAILTSRGLWLNNGVNDTFTVDSATGNVVTTGSLKVGNGLNVTGGTTTDSLLVTGTTTTHGIDNSGGGITNAGAISGLTTLNASGDITTSGHIIANGGAQIGTGANQLTINGGGQLTNGLTVSNGNTSLKNTQVNGTLGVTGLSTLVGINNSGALNQDGVATFTNTAVAGQGTTTVNGGVVTTGTVNAAIGNITTVNSTTLNTANANISNSLAVANGANVNMGDNVVHGVATPIFGTDAANKAYVDRGLNKAYQGTAIALALSQPIFAPGQTWAIRAGWGGYESQNAGGVTVAGIVGRDWFGGGSTVAIDGGVGFSDNGAVAGKAGVTIGFGGGYIPMK